MPGHILIVTPHSDVQTMLANQFRMLDYESSSYADPVEAYQSFVESDYKLVICDIDFKEDSGCQFIQQIRDHSPVLPVIVVTKLEGTEPMLRAFQAGADDFLRWPIVPEELSCRCYVHLRRLKLFVSMEKNRYSFQIGNYLFDAAKHTLTNRRNEITHLSSRENNLLLQLVRHRNALLSREKALELVWGISGDEVAMRPTMIRNVDVYVSKLRKYLSGDPNVQIASQRGKGFKLLIY